MPSEREFTVQPPFTSLRNIVQSGTRRMGAATGAGTVSFPTRFSGSPIVQLTPLAGSSAFGRTIALGVRSVFPGSFTYRGSPSAGTFSWMAHGPIR